MKVATKIKVRLVPISRHNIFKRGIIYEALTERNGRVNKQMDNKHNENRMIIIIIIIAITTTVSESVFSICRGTLISIEDEKSDTYTYIKTNYIYIYV